MKAKKASKLRSGLTFSVPSDIKLKELSEASLLTPDGLHDDKDYAPLDFTSISSREVGRQHSAWAVRHSYLLYLIGNLRAELGNVKYDLKTAEGEWLSKRAGKYKTKWQAEKAMGASKRIRRLRSKSRRVEASLARYEALASSYQAIREAASREMTRRATEVGSRD